MKNYKTKLKKNYKPFYLLHIKIEFTILSRVKREIGKQTKKMKFL